MGCCISGSSLSQLSLLAYTALTLASKALHSSVSLSAFSSSYHHLFGINTSISSPSSTRKGSSNPSGGYHLPSLEPLLFRYASSGSVGHHELASIGLCPSLVADGSRSAHSCFSIWCSIIFPMHTRICRQCVGWERLLPILLRCGLSPFCDCNVRVFRCRLGILDSCLHFDCVHSDSVRVVQVRRGYQEEVEERSSRLMRDKENESCMHLHLKPELVISIWSMNRRIPINRWHDRMKRIDVAYLYKTP